MENIDPDIARWVLEFLLKQNLDDRTIDALIRTLPLPNDNPKLKKSLLLKKLESHIATRSISEKTLELLEQIEELDFQLGIEVPSDAMKRAYCAVAVECTTAFLGDGDKGNANYSFFDAVKRIWRGKVQKMAQLEKGGLCSKELLDWKDEMETAVWEDTVCKNVVEKSKEINAVDAVRDYLAGEKNRTGPSFLELVAEKLKDEKTLNEVFSFREKEATLGSDAPNNCRAQKGDAHPRRKHAARKPSKRILPASSRGAKIIESDDLAAGPSCSRYDLPPTPVVNKVQAALESSTLELQQAVRDPLPDALRLAEELSGRARENNDQAKVEQNNVRANPSAVGTSGPQDNGSLPTNHSCRNENDVPKRNLMERNSSAHTYEWDDSIDGSKDASLDLGGRPRLPSPRRGGVSPLDIYKFEKLPKRRKIKRWSNLEEDTLRAGVQKYGRGNWKIILNAYHDIFDGRTEVDLKDKWRNMMR